MRRAVAALLSGYRRAAPSVLSRHRTVRNINHRALPITGRFVYHPRAPVRAHPARDALVWTSRIAA